MSLAQRSGAGPATREQDAEGPRRRFAGALPRWWPLAALTLLAAALRLSTLDLQSFWYDEAFTPVHVLHPGLWATLRAVSHTENTPPLWYVLAWASARLFGTGAIALRWPSALAGIATVPVVWGIGYELAGRGPSGRRAALVAAALVAVNPLFFWYSQEARAYALYAFCAALALLCFLRADREPTPRRLALFALTGALALLSFYFAVFLLVPMALWLLRPRRAAGGTAPPGAHGAARGDRADAPGTRGRHPPSLAALAAVAALALVGLALLPLISAQGGHGTQWIGAWALSSRLEAIPQYYLTGYTGASLGHGIELLVALLILTAVGYGLWRALTPRESDGALLGLAITACAVLIPVAMALLGADYLAPRNLIGAMIPLTATLAVIIAARRTARVGLALAGLIALAFLALSVDIDLSPRLQRGDWRGLAQVVAAHAPGAGARVITTVELGAAPLEYYLPPLHNLARDSSVRVREIDETGYAPLRPGAGASPAAGFRLEGRYDVNGLILFRFRSPTPRTVPEAVLREHVITLAHPEVLVVGRGPASTGAP
jgi:mannosyltransferase